MGEGTVLVRRRSLGDVVLLGAVTAAAPSPVTVVTSPPYVALAQRFRGVDRAVAWGEGRPTGRVIDLQRDLRSLWAFPTARRVRKHTVARRARLWGLGTGRPAVTSLYAEAVGVAAELPPWIEVDRHATDGLAIVVGASTALKAADLGLLARMGRRWEGPVHVLAGPDDQEQAEVVAAGVPGARVTCETGFERTLEVLGGCGVALGGDTGLLHVAAAAGARPVVVCGPTHPDDGFWPAAQVVARTNLSCRPCTLHRGSSCHRGDLACHDLGDDVTWRAVAEAACAGSC